MAKRRLYSAVFISGEQARIDRDHPEKLSYNWHKELSDALKTKLADNRIGPAGTNGSAYLYLGGIVEDWMAISQDPTVNSFELLRNPKYHRHETRFIHEDPEGLAKLIKEMGFPPTSPLPAKV